MGEIDGNEITIAYKRLAGIANQTPVITSRSLDELTGAQVFLKCENFQRGGAFKFRGAYNAISQLTLDQKKVGVITHSSGNHAQGIALAASLLDVKATVVMPQDAPAIKRAATAGYGASIVPCRAIDREKITAELVESHGYTLIHPYDNFQIIAGQGTAALELFMEVGDLNFLFVPVGGGGLISGSALAASKQSPRCQVIGVEPEIAADARRSWLEDRIYWLDQVPDTIADGLRPLHIGEKNLPIMRRYVADMTTVSEDAIVEAFGYIWDRLKIIIEPSSAVAFAPLLDENYPLRGKKVGIIISGGNLDRSNPILEKFRIRKKEY